ncbi:Prodigiosin synthesizing transferase PigC [Acidibacillus sp. S0AB]|uniref:Phosphoenolpyruvate synthase n=1 Tax=Sulfoacidibacillus ferrooxidans TaxID=2005001 RepID=A0A9X1VET7_9BACL|nr:Prodigiosin synthesizing transferase PigC [Sulfoacidibacillus ferrooxidans]
MYIVPLQSAASLLGKSRCGSKAYELSRLLEKGYPVPDGVVVTQNAYRPSCMGADATARSVNERWNWVTPEVLEQIIPAFGKLIEVYGAVSVRSSCSAEDLTEASFAGQYETVLNVQTKDELLHALQVCWGSVSDGRVRAYAREKQVDLCDCAMSVVIQGMVQADQAGVAFSRHPVTTADTVFVNASYGLGEAVVSGIVTPDAFEYVKATGELVKELGDKEVQVVRAASGVQEQAVPLVHQMMYCLTDAEVLELCELVVHLEGEYDAAIDVEFAFAQGRLYLLQVRPITTTQERTVYGEVPIQ